MEQTHINKTNYGNRAIHNETPLSTAIEYKDKFLEKALLKYMDKE